LHSFRLASGSSISPASALAWLAHLHALRTFLSSGVSTALILEDDVDFDPSIRSHQIRSSPASCARYLSALILICTGPRHRRGTSYTRALRRHAPLALKHPAITLTHSTPDATIPPHLTLHPDTSTFQPRYTIQNHSSFCTDPSRRCAQLHTPCTVAPHRSSCSNSTRKRGGGEGNGEGTAGEGRRRSVWLIL
jgi:hypothetical protein